ncbi:MAG: TlpA family protein disulfide reductase [Putridiphycobacter sp.]
MKKQLYILLFCVGFLNLAFGQNDSIMGYAPDFVGQKVTLYTIDDYLTMTRIKIGEGMVDSKDSVFRIKNEVKSTIKGIIEIGRTESELYIQPNQTYKLGYYKPDKLPMSFVNQKIETIFYDLDSTDINYKVLQYNQWFDTYIYYHQLDIVKQGLPVYLDTFKMYAYEAYKEEEDPYFVNYVRYNIALMEQVKVSNKYKNARIDTYLQYINPFPVYAKNDQYMNFVKAFYPEDFEGYVAEIKSSVYLAINHESPTRLMHALRKDPLLKNIELREMMMVNMLGKSYYKRGYNRKEIITILDSVSQFAKYEINAVASANMIKYLTKIEEGYPAPQFETIQETDTINLNRYNGQFLYVNFFASWNQMSVNEMRLIKELKLKYGRHISFLSFCTDYASLDYKHFIEQHPDYDWDIVFLGDKSEIAQQFNVKTIPSYFLINPEGFIAMAPARSPSPDGVYKSIEETFEYIQASYQNH